VGVFNLIARVVGKSDDAGESNMILNERNDLCTDLCSRQRRNDQNVRTPCVVKKNSPTYLRHLFSCLYLTCNAWAAWATAASTTTLSS